MFILGFIFCFLTIILVGWLAAKKQRASKKDYFLASQSIHPIAAGLSAISSTLSGFMFIGVLGFTWKSGLYAVVSYAAIIFGNYLNWIFFAPKLTTAWNSGKREFTSFSDFVTYNSKSPEHSKKKFRGILALIMFVFLGSYAAAQLNAGGKALHVLFSWPIWSGAVLGSVIVFLYCLAGGIRATIWTDVVQATIMFVAMTILAFICYFKVGGFVPLWQKLEKIDPALINFLPQGHEFQGVLGIVGMIFFGMGVLGQPHVMVRALVFSQSQRINTVRRVYFFYFLSFSILTFFVTLCGRVLLDPSINFDPELVLPQLAAENLPAFLSGLVLAGIFASAMSTADSQVIAITHCLSEDLLPMTHSTHAESKTKATTLSVILFITIVALFGSESVAGLVFFSWSALAVTLGPLLFLTLYNISLPVRFAMVMIFSSLAVSMVWVLTGSNRYVSEVVPGFLTSLFFFMIYHRKKLAVNRSCIRMRT